MNIPNPPSAVSAGRRMVWDLVMNTLHRSQKMFSVTLFLLCSVTEELLWDGPVLETCPGD